jgi:hypothetical protein
MQARALRYHILNTQRALSLLLNRLQYTTTIEQLLRRCATQMC